MAPVISAEEAEKLQTFLSRKLSPELTVQRRQRPDECADIYVGTECLGVVAKNLDDGEVSYSFELVVLDIDLEGL